MPEVIIKQVVEDIREADFVLVGIGEEMGLQKKLRADERYLGIAETINENSLLPFAEKVMLDKLRKECRGPYRDLENCLKGKNYFIVSLCQDGGLADTELDPERIVEPCGTYQRLQCPGGCNKELFEIPADTLAEVEVWLSDGGPAGKKEPEIPSCPYCGKPLIFNNVEAENYLEKGYLDKWKVYQKWLQGSLNRKLCILELGVGMKYPTVIRWPFERVAFFNMKAKLYRVHSRLYQIAQEIKDRSCGICQKPEEFLKELSNGFQYGKLEK